MGSTGPAQQHGISAGRDLPTPLRTEAPETLTAASGSAAIVGDGEGGPADGQELAAHLGERLAYFSKLFEEGRIDELVDTFYAEDAVVEGPGIPLQRGRDAIKTIFAEARKGYKAILIRMDPLLHPGNDLAYCFITNRNVRNDDAVEVHRAALVWRKVGRDWLCQTDFFFVP